MAATIFLPTRSIELSIHLSQKQVSSSLAMISACLMAGRGFVLEPWNFCGDSEATPVVIKPADAEMMIATMGRWVSFGSDYEIVSNALN